MKKKFYFEVRTVQGEIVNLVSKGKDSKQAKEKLLASLKNNVKEILSVSEHYPINNIEEEEVLEKVSFYIKDKTRRGMRIFN